MVFRILIVLIANILALETAQAGQQPELEALGFSKEHATDLINACLHSQLECRILTRQIDGKNDVVTLIGERHDQMLLVYDAGARLLEHYAIIGLEPSEVIRAYEQSPFVGLMFQSLMYLRAALSGPRTTKSLMGYRNSARAIFDLEAGAPDYFGTNEFRNASLSVAGWIVCVIFLQSGLVSTLLQVSLGIAALGQTLMACGSTLSMLSDPKIRERDTLMAKNLIDSMTTLVETHLAAVMGMAHLYGVSKLLNQHGFVDQSSILVAEDSSSCLYDRTFELACPQHRKLLLETRARIDYPEDFK
jgi:hypothetical protein